MSTSDPEESEEIMVIDLESPEYGKPARAPKNSLWAKQRGVDFFLPPAMSLETLEYLNFNGEGPVGALRERFGLPTRKADPSDRNPAPGERDPS
jgi:hypothetical protein